jgi:hypothetical protein
VLPSVLVHRLWGAEKIYPQVPDEKNRRRMEGALRQLGGYLKAARKLSRQGADYSRVNEEDKERIVEMTDMIFREDIAEDDITTMAASEDNSRRPVDSLCPPVTTLAKDNLSPPVTTLPKDNLSPPVTTLPKDEKQELIDETLAALRSLDELGERVESVRRENRLLRKAKRALQRRPLESTSLSCPLIAGP